MACPQRAGRVSHSQLLANFYLPTRPGTLATCLNGKPILRLPSAVLCCGRGVVASSSSKSCEKHMRLIGEGLTLSGPALNSEIPNGKAGDNSGAGTGTAARSSTGRRPTALTASRGRALPKVLDQARGRESRAGRRYAGSLPGPERCVGWSPISKSNGGDGSPRGYI